MPSSYPAICKAVFPIAGLGTRFLPATKASPKEMLPVVDKPLIQYAVEEAYEAGIRQMIFVTGRNKRAIEDHFDTAYELESELHAAQKTELIQIVSRIKPDDMECIYIRQSRAWGLGHAIWCARSLIGQEPFAVLLADDLMRAKPNVTAQLIAAYQQTGHSVLAVQEVEPHHVHQYGVIKPPSDALFSAGSRLHPIEGIVEKPKAEHAPSRFAVAGRYVLTPQIVDFISLALPYQGKEIQLTDAISKMLSSQAVSALLYEGERFDCGSKIGFLQASVSLGMQHPELKADFIAWLQSLNISK